MVSAGNAVLWLPCRHLSTDLAIDRGAVHAVIGVCTHSMAQTRGGSLAVSRQCIASMVGKLTEVPPSRLAPEQTPVHRTSHMANIITGSLLSAPSLVRSSFRVPIGICGSCE